MKKDVTIKEVFERLRKRHDIENAKQLDELPWAKDSVVSTGIIGLDKALGVGGIRKGSIVEIYAPESTGKTTLALHLCKQYQKENMPVLYIESERTLTKETIQGIGIRNEGFYLLNIDTLEKALEVCKMSAPAFGAIVIDSLPGLVPAGYINGDMGDSHMGLFSRIMSDALPVLVPILAENGCTLIITNQIREKVGVMFGCPEKTMGGRALKYYASVRLDMRRTESIKQAGEIIGNHIRMKVVKNKIATPYKEVEFDIMFGEGISTEGDLLDCATEEGIIDKRYTEYSYRGKPIGRGRESAKDYLRGHPLEVEQIRNGLRKAYFS